MRTPGQRWILVAIALTFGCSVFKEYVQDRSPDAARFLIHPTLRDLNGLAVYEDPVTCRGWLDLNGSSTLGYARRAQLVPGKLFGFTVSVAQSNAYVEKSCRVAAFFTPAPRAFYKARVLGTVKECSVEVVQVLDGREVEVPDLRVRPARDTPEGPCF